MNDNDTFREDALTLAARLEVVVEGWQPGLILLALATLFADVAGQAGENAAELFRLLADELEGGE